ncbi:MAG TPA: AbrB/MazE/SpoVT family DNA-binding domain-containing protein [Gemmatimonadales bacterium]|nr:AbrB/MazE/SpoVT family DNA-binding domain-containing protein [Gemmatimonadales bacterium]
MTIRTRPIRIGNSRGIRLPKPVIEEAGLSDEVEPRVRPGAVVIQPAAGPRTGWAEAARRLRERGGGELLEAVTRSRFDEQELRWLAEAVRRGDVYLVNLNPNARRRD